MIIKKNIKHGIICSLYTNDRAQIRAALFKLLNPMVTDAEIQGGCRTNLFKTANENDQAAVHFHVVEVGENDLVIDQLNSRLTLTITRNEVSRFVNDIFALTDGVENRYVLPLTIHHRKKYHILGVCYYGGRNNRSEMIESMKKSIAEKYAYTISMIA